MNMGEKIKALRQQRGMTLEEFGNLVGVGKSTVRKWENGMIANMRRDKIAAVAKALNVTPGYLMGWDEEPNLPPKVSRITRYPKQIEVAERICQDGAEVIFDAYDLEPDKLTDYARMICLTSGDSRHLATAAHSSATKVPQEDLDLLDEV